MGVGRGGDHLAQEALGRQIAEAMDDSLSGRPAGERQAENRARLLSDLRGDPDAPGFARAVRHIVASIVGYPAAPNYEGLRKTVCQQLLGLHRHELADLGALAVLLAVGRIEQEQEEYAEPAKTQAAPLVLQHLILLLRIVHDQYHHQQSARLATSIDLLIVQAEKQGLIEPFTQAAGTSALDYALTLNTVGKEGAST